MKTKSKRAAKTPTVSDQPPPTPTAGPAIWDLVIADMRQRDSVGRQRSTEVTQ